MTAPISYPILKDKMYDKLDLMEEHAKMPSPDTSRILQLINQIESLVDLIEDNPTKDSATS